MQSLQTHPEATQGPGQPSEAVRGAFRALLTTSKAVTDALHGHPKALDKAQDEQSKAVSALRTALASPPNPSPGVGESGSLG